MDTATNHHHVLLHLPHKFLIWLVWVNKCLKYTTPGSTQEWKRSVSHGRAYMANLWAKECHVQKLTTSFHELQIGIGLLLSTPHVFASTSKTRVFKTLPQESFNLLKSFHLRHILPYLPYKVCGPSVPSFISLDIYIFVVCDQV